MSNRIITGLCRNKSSRVGAPEHLELYDYQKDPLEKKNIAGEDVATVASLRKILNQYPEAQPQVATSDKDGPKGKRGKKNN